MTDRVAANYLKNFLDRHPVRKFKKGEIIIFQGEAPRYAYAVKSGTVKAYNLSVSGDEKPVAFYPEDNIFPASWIYGKVPSAIYYYEAFTSEVEVYLIDRSKYVSYVKRSPELLYLELERLLTDQLGGSMRLNALQHSRASDKLIYTLHYLALTHGKPVDDADGTIEITLDLTHQDFANLTGLTRETAATELNKLKKQNIINYGKNVPYQLNIKRLLQLVNDQFIADIQPATLVS
ncbi:MAG TPA: Crp/Fnr family transcriptional regulator [Candidatus Saccharimonadales bacterium]|nr:Crp/Fnr family transcriptional regulator [Candidatus Saccharimonadales bacterium]